MPSTVFPGPKSGKTRTSREEYLDANGRPFDDTAAGKRPRLGERLRNPRRNIDSVPKWLIQDKETTTSQDPTIGTLVGDIALIQYTSGHMLRPRERHQTCWQTRIYVGNLPSEIGLQQPVFAQLFAAVYVTAFGALQPGEAAPVESFWLHSCRRYGFLQMRGPKEAVNILLFNGIVLHGRVIRLSRPTGYRPEVRDFSAEDFVSDRVDGERIAILFKALHGIVGAPSENAYLTALQQDEAKTIEKGDIRKAGPSGTGTRGHSMETSRNLNENIGATHSRSVSDVLGTVVALVDLVKSFQLDDKVEYEDILLDVRDECCLFGTVESVLVPKEGEWTGTAFVQFAKPNQAQQAVKGMSKRGFEGQKIGAYIVEECDTAEEASIRPRPMDSS